MLRSSANFWPQSNVTSAQNCSWSTLVMRCGWLVHSLLGANSLPHHFRLFILCRTTFNNINNNTTLGTQPEFMELDRMRPIPTHLYWQALPMLILLLYSLNSSMPVLVHLLLMCSKCRHSVHQLTQGNCHLCWTHQFYQCLDLQSHLHPMTQLRWTIQPTRFIPCLISSRQYNAQVH